MAVNFKDHFSEHSENYQRYRPEYPAALFAFLASISPANEIAWDCATGTGQAAKGLADYFECVVASDASKNQVENAWRTNGIKYIVGTAENSIFKNSKVDLITVSQALHWFYIDGFFKEAARVLKPNGILAVWTYNLLTVTTDVDAIIEDFYEKILGDFWPKERRLVETGYGTINFPFQNVPSPFFEMTAEWDLDAFMGYISTWSAVKKFQRANQRSPMAPLYAKVCRLWGDPQKKYTVRWPLILKTGQYIT